MLSEIKPLAVKMRLFGFAQGDNTNNKTYETLS